LVTLPDKPTKPPSLQFWRQLRPKVHQSGERFCAKPSKPLLGMFLVLVVVLFVVLFVVLVLHVFPSPKFSNFRLLIKVE
jgi:hypothetical protein